MINITKKFDWTTLILLLILMFLGVVAIYSASTVKIGDTIQTNNYYQRQLLWIFISLIVLILQLNISYQVIEIILVPAYILVLFFLILVLFLPTIKGAHRWIPLAFFKFQPSELAKIVTILLVAKYISKRHLSETQILLRGFIITIPVFLLVLVEPDLGTSLTLIVSLFAMFYASELRFFFVIILISPILSLIFSFSIPLFIIYLILLIFILYKNRLSHIIIAFTSVINLFIFFLTPLLWNTLKSYQQNRILTFFNPAKDPFGSGYQIIQAKIAVGSGGFWGKGFLDGTQKNLNFLPEHHTDFIFSVIGEEFGFFGCIIIVGLYFLILYRIAKKTMLLKKDEERIAAVGILAYLTFQIFINIGMNLGIVPTTGIPLPFISYGGTNLLINVMAVGFILKFFNERSVFH